MATKNAADIYRQFEAATQAISAYAILKDGEQVGKLVFKFPKDGASRQWCYLHVLGSKMVRGSATGYGYDKGSASASSAARALVLDPETFQPARTHLEAIKAALEPDDGFGWDRRLRDAGFIVFQVC